MCRNIKILFNFSPPVTEEEVRSAALQFVRKVSGFNKPSRRMRRRSWPPSKGSRRSPADFWARLKPARRRGIEKWKPRSATLSCQRFLR